MVIRKYQRAFNALLIMLDAIMLALAYAFACYHHLQGDGFAQGYALYFMVALWMIPLVLVTYYFMEVYSPMRRWLFRQEMLLIIRAHLVGMVLVYSISYLTKISLLTPEELLMFGFCGLLAIAMERAVVRRSLHYLREIGYNQKHMLIIGAGAPGREFARKILAHRDFGYNLVGFLDDDEAKQGSERHGRPILGRFDILPELLAGNTIDEVVVALPLSAYDKFAYIIDCCEREGIRMHIILDYYNMLPGYPKIENFDGTPLLQTRHIPLHEPVGRFLKRSADIVVSVLALIVVAPVFLVIAIGIKITSPGPVFFRQERIGLNNKPFNMLKFRSMRIMDESVANTCWTTADDPRKTMFGAFLRKTSLDELPQFINVLIGDMSVVGPRPERPFFVEQFKKQIPKYMVKHQVKPGITGWAQVNGWRGDTSIEKRVECDIYYIENWDLLLDIKIMFLTVFKGLINRNAY
jgi:Undecaprenyl-phosphate glucose phosphotransferase